MRCIRILVLLISWTMADAMLLKRHINSSSTTHHKNLSKEGINQDLVALSAHRRRGDPLDGDDDEGDDVSPVPAPTPFPIAEKEISRTGQLPAAETSRAEDSETSTCDGSSCGEKRDKGFLSFDWFLGDYHFQYWMLVLLGGGMFLIGLFSFAFYLSLKQSGNDGLPAGARPERRCWCC